MCDLVQAILKIIPYPISAKTIVIRDSTSATSGVHRRHHKEQWQWTSHRLPHHGILAGLGKVSYSLFIHKLDQYGIKGKTNAWTNGSLSGRTQCVVIEGEMSDIVQMRSSTGISRGTLSLFTDDTIAYLTLSIDSNILKGNLNKLTTWEDKWMGQFNSGKCVVLPITKRKNQYK